MPERAKRRKRITQAKVDRARDALMALTECEDFGVHLSSSTIRSAIDELSGFFPDHPSYSESSSRGAIGPSRDGSVGPN